MDVDVTVFDNADTKKEGAGFTYNKRFGFAPIFAHLDGGWIVGAQLRPGSAHSCSEGTEGFFLSSVDRAHAMVEEVPVLVVADSGFDSQTLIRGLYEKDWTDLVIKHNLRKESKESWLEIAREKAHEVKEFAGKRESGRIYTGSAFREVQGLKEPVPMVFEVTEMLQQKGKQLLVPEIRVCVLWTSLGLPEEKVLNVYVPGIQTLCSGIGADVAYCKANTGAEITIGSNFLPPTANREPVNRYNEWIQGLMIRNFT